jgi:hemoglobin-like flavoprotein
MIYWIKRKVWQVQNIFAWMPVVWKLHDWDYNYATDVFIYQLNRLANALDCTRATHVSSKIRAKHIRICTSLLQKSINDVIYYEKRNSGLSKEDALKYNTKAYNLAWKLIKDNLRDWWDY